jgi:hypothetical protein
LSPFRPRFGLRTNTDRKQMPTISILPPNIPLEDAIAMK